MPRTRPRWLRHFMRKHNLSGQTIWVVTDHNKRIPTTSPVTSSYTARAATEYKLAFTSPEVALAAARDLGWAGSYFDYMVRSRYIHGNVDISIDVMALYERKINDE